jgi:putative transposase
LCFLVPTSEEVVVSDEDLRKEAVRRRRGGESAEEIAEALGRTARWVRKWVVRAEEEAGDEGWAKGRSRAPHRSPGRTPEELRRLIVDARLRLEANPRAQYGPLAVAWELRRLGVDPIPNRWTIEREIARAGLAKPRRRPYGYVPKGVPYPERPMPGPGDLHQIDLVGPRHLHGGVEFHALNLLDVGSHEAASEILQAPRPNVVAEGLVGMWSLVGVPLAAQFDNHSNFRGAIPPASASFGPVVAACLDLGVTPRFIPLREPWRNGVVERFNDVWDKSFFRTASFTNLEHLRGENASFIAFHNAQHRYTAHGGASPAEIWRARPRYLLEPDYRVPTRLPAKGWIEAVRYVRSSGLVDLWGKRITLEETYRHAYVTAVIRVRAKQVSIVTADGEIAYEGSFPVSRILR